MIEFLTGAGTLGALSGALAYWLLRDGPVRLVAGILAVLHRDPVRRRDARAVLRCTREQRSAAEPPTDSG